MAEQEKGAPKPIWRERTAALLAPPGGVGAPRVELIGAREVYLENYKGILSYGREEIHVDGGGWILRVAGEDLEIQAMAPGQLRLTGRVTGLDLL